MEQRTRPDGDARECHTPWDVGIFLADEHWPSIEAVTASDEYEYEEDVEEAIMTLCFGLRAEPRDIDPADLPERVRNRVLMAARAAGSAPDSDSIMWNLDKNSIAELVNEDEWSLVIISSCLISMWEHDQSPMSGRHHEPAGRRPAGGRHTGRGSAVAAGIPIGLIRPQMGRQQSGKIGVGLAPRGPTKMNLKTITITVICMLTASALTLLLMYALYRLGYNSVQ